jgi:hypothetical protein
MAKGKWSPFKLPAFPPEIYTFHFSIKFTGSFQNFQLNRKKDRFG